MRRTRPAKTTLPRKGRVIVDQVVVDQVVQVVGSLLVLAGFAAGQRGWLSPHSPTYLSLNFAGSATLAVEAAIGEQWGFLLLEAVWAAVSLAGLVRDGSVRRGGEGAAVQADEVCGQRGRIESAGAQPLAHRDHVGEGPERAHADEG